MTAMSAFTVLRAREQYQCATYTDAVSRVITDGFAVFCKRPVFRQICASVDEQWREFCAESSEFKRNFSVKLSSDPRDGPDNGYKNPNDYNLDADPKEYFHVRPVVLAEKMPAALRGGRYGAFLHHCYFLHELLCDEAERAADELDRLLPGYSFTKLIKSQRADPYGHVLRLLHYNEQAHPGDRLAKGHGDRDFGTFHVFDSEPGLVLERTDHGEELVETDSASMLFFFGKKASVLTRDGTPPLRWLQHKVVASPAVINSGRARTCMVFFSHVPMTEIELALASNLRF